MDAPTDIYLTWDDTSQNLPASSLTVAREHEHDNTALNECSIPDNFGLFSPNVHPSLVSDGGYIATHQEQGSVQPFEPDQVPSDIHAEINSIDHENTRICPESNSDQAVLPTSPEQFSTSERVVAPAGESALMTSIDDAQAPTVVCAQEPLSSQGADLDDRVRPVRVLHAEQGHSQTAKHTPLTDEEETREGFDYPCEDLPPSAPPSSSPPQLFSSSPHMSSQSSIGDIEPPKTALTIEVESGTSPPGDVSDYDVTPAVQDNSGLEFEDPRGHGTAEVITGPVPDECALQKGASTSCIEDDLELLSKRNADRESHDPQPVKRPKLDSRPYLPPAPRRPTPASQSHQFKKLTAPFRPPLKPPIAADGLVQAMNNRKVELAISTISETKNIPKQSMITLSRRKASHVSKSVTQFKSPLVNRAPPAGSCAIRLTPALQALERKLQLLKRAIKVKEENEEEVLARLAGKWIEAGREVAYDVWDATKEAGDFTGKVSFIQRSHGWANTNNANVPWGWDTKPGDAGEGTCEPDPSESSCATGQLTPEEDDDVGYNTLGTMLRQLGIAPEIFGWDDDKEAFFD